MLRTRHFFLVLSLLFVYLFVNHFPVATQSLDLETFIQPYSVVDTSVINTNITITGVDDASAVEGAPSTTHPSDSYLLAGYDNGSFYPTGRSRAYIRFDLSSIPAEGTLVSATFRIYHAGGQDFAGVSRNVTFYHVTETWEDSNLVWNNLPAYAEALGASNTTYDEQGWFELDITQLVADWMSGAKPNYGIVAVGPETVEGAYRLFFASEVANGPEILVRHIPAPPPVLDSWPGEVEHEIAVSSTANVSFNVGNVTYDSLEWEAEEVNGVPWLQIDNSNGDVTPPNPDAVSLTIDTSSLSVGTYSEQIRVTSNTPSVVNSPMLTTITINVVESLKRVYLPIVLGGYGPDGEENPSTESWEVYALSVGVSDYAFYGSANSSDARFPDEWGDGDLVTPHLDAIAFNDLLDQEHTHSLQEVTHLIQDVTHEPNLYLRTNSGATLANVNADFEAITDAINALPADTNSLFIFYFSGHGAQNPDNNGDEVDGLDEIIMLHEATPNGASFTGVLSDDELEAILSNINATQIVVVIDSCFSGSMASDTMALPINGLQHRGISNPNLLKQPTSISEADATLAELNGEGRLIITGGTGDQLTYEESNILKHGVFTYFFLQGLEEGLYDVNKNGRISFEEAYWFTRDAVDDWIIENVGENQNPAIHDDIPGQVDVTWVQ